MTVKNMTKDHKILSVQKCKQRDRNSLTFPFFFYFRAKFIAHWKNVHHNGL